MGRADMLRLGKGSFQLLGPLGAGGYGKVYEAIDPVTDQRVALKELSRVTSSSLAHFKREFRALADLHHPHLVGLKGLFEHEGRWFIAMELVEGKDVLTHVRGPAPSAGFDEQKLRRAFYGVAQGLVALHDYGVLHRDLKPSNVRVDRDGNAVLLDFGLVAMLDPASGSVDADGAGTAAYMAPEQMQDERVGPEMDFYALGICLFEALTGRLPFVGASSRELLQQKLSHAPVRPSAVASEVPDDLDVLCTQLLALDPAQRPKGPELVARLSHGLSAEERRLGAQGVAVQSIGSFAGREPELERLDRALARSQDGALRIVLIEGESGVGKTGLVEEFLRRRRVADARFVALRGRCYENEQLPYKAFDGCIDELAEELTRLDLTTADAVLPARAGLLAQLFPVLRRVPAIATASTLDTSADLTARRLEAFSALSHLLSRLAEERALVLVTDDLQWADDESFRMLHALVEDASPAPVLVVATVRPREELESPVQVKLDAIRSWKCCELIHLVGLPAAEARELARRLLGAEDHSNWSDIIAAESRGHPLFMSELVHYTRSHDLRGGGALTLEAALQARISRLDDRSRELLELVALAGRPYSAQLFADALQVANVEESAKWLMGAKLLRARMGHELVCFHDRIRQVTVEMMPRARRQAVHGALAAALADAMHEDWLEQARHWDLACRSERAIDAYERSGDQALSSLAFARAEQLYTRALELLSDRRDAQYGRVLVQRAYALGCAGRSAEAAAQYTQAATLVHGNERIRLRSRAAQHLLQSAQVEPGIRAARALLAELGVKLPDGRAGAYFMMGWGRFIMSMRGRRSTARVVGPEQEKAVLALDIVSELNTALLFVEPLLGLSLSMEYVLRATALGERAHLAQAYAYEGWLLAQVKSLRAAEPAFAASRALHEGLNLPAGLAHEGHAEGSAALIHWDFTRAERLLEASHHLLQTQCVGNPWLLTNTRLSLGSLWRSNGEHARLAEHMEQWLSEARERKDVYARAILAGLGFGHLRHLMKDAPDAAQAELREVIDALPREPVAYAHLGDFVASQQILLYVGGAGALEWLRANQQRYERTFLFQTHLGKEVTHLYGALAALRALETASDSEREQLLALASTNARALARVKSPFALAHAQLIAAQVAALSGRLDEALGAVHDARERFDAMGHMSRHAAAYLAGTLANDRHGADARETALLAYHAQGWKQPFRGIAMTVPALALLADGRARGAQVQAKKLLRDRYEVLRTLGSGGFGRVMEAHDAVSGSNVALKELLRASAGALSRFKQEFRAVQDVHHPNLVRLDALFEERGTWYIAMELVAGTDLTSWVRTPDGFDPARVFAAFLGLVRGVSALHAAGMVHRDIHPGNVRVTSDGRAVLLDFGLIAYAHDARDACMVGTPEFVPPEQLDGHEPDRAADVYALGVCLYQALTGRLPFSSSNPVELAKIKRNQAPTPPSQTAKHLPAELDVLCARMLAPAPEQRPTLAEVQEALGSLVRDRTGHGPSAALLGAAPARVPFRGRQAELAQLLGRFEQSRDGDPSLCIIEGESGLGKTALMNELVQRLTSQQPELWVMRSRCYENEQIAFKAFDGIVDELALLLLNRTSSEAQALLPRRVALLAQLFPVLNMVPAVAEAPKKGLPIDPSVRRREAFLCFIELFTRLGKERPVLLLIDDLQWADDESFGLLRDLLSAEARPALMLVATARPGAEFSASAAEGMRALDQCGAVRRVTLPPLAPSEVEPMLRTLLGETVDAQVIERLAQESKGHPLFVRELAEHAKAGGLSERPLTLDEALLSRVERLDRAAREVVDAVAILGKPYATHVLSRALRAGGSVEARGFAREQNKDEVITRLLAQGLVRRRSDRGLSISHDRIRRVVIEALEPARKRELCGRLAEALDADPAVDPVERARLWDEAEAAERASLAYEQAGVRALEGLAFGGAVQLLQRALALCGNANSARENRLRVLRGHALARNGDSAQAAEVYREACATASGDDKTRLRVWTAQQLIQSLQIEQGLVEAGGLLSELKAPLPTSETAALSRIAWERACMAFRGRELGTVATKPAGREDALVLDALYDLILPIYVTAPWPGSALTVRYLRRALRSGTLPHIARAFGLECTLRSLRAPSEDHEALMAETQALAERTGEPAVIAGVGLTLGTARIVQCRFELARRHMERVHEIVQTQCPGEPWMLTNARMHLGWIWQLTGEYAQLTSHLEAWLAEARERKDRFAYGILASYGSAVFRHLLRDDPDALLAELEAAMRPWPDVPFAFPHLGEAIMTVYGHRYRGGAGAHEHLQRSQRYLDNRYVRMNPSANLLLTSARGSAALEAIESLEGAGTAALLKLARHEARRAGGIASPLCRGAQNALLSVIAALAGRREQALEHARIAIRVYSEAGHVQRHASSYLEGLLEGGEAGREKREGARAFFAAQGFQRPERGIAVHLPAMRLLTQSYG